MDREKSCFPRDIRSVVGSRATPPMSGTERARAARSIRKHRRETGPDPVPVAREIEDGRAVYEHRLKSFDEERLEGGIARKVGRGGGAPPAPQASDRGPPLRP